MTTPDFMNTERKNTMGYRALVLSVATVALAVTATPALADFIYTPLPEPVKEPIAEPRIAPAGASAIKHRAPGEPDPLPSTLRVGPVEPALPPGGDEPKTATAAAAPKMTAPPLTVAPVPVKVYSLRSGETVRDAFERWTKSAGWTLVWDVNLEYPVEVTHQFAPGMGLEDAMGSVLASYWGTPNALVAQTYENKVVRIVRGNGAH